MKLYFQKQTQDITSFKKDRQQYKIEYETWYRKQVS